MTVVLSETPLSIRVYYEDTDAGGVVYHASYLRFAERARTELMRRCGGDHPSLLAEHGLVFAVRHCEIDYIKPARLDDLLDVHTIVTGVGAASFDMKQDVMRNGDALAKLNLQLVCVSREGRPKRLPTQLRETLAGLSPAKLKP